MACTTVPESISNGYYVPVKSSYSDGDQVFYVCSQNYVMSGSPTVTCTSGAWVGDYPSCSLSFLSNGTIQIQDLKSVSKDLDDNDISETELAAVVKAYFYIIGAIVLILFIVVLAILCVFCCRYSCRRNRVQDDDDGDEAQSGCCRCCRSSSRDKSSDNKENNPTNNKEKDKIVKNNKGKNRQVKNKNKEKDLKVKNFKGKDIKKEMINLCQKRRFINKEQVKEDIVEGKRFER